MGVISKAVPKAGSSKQRSESEPIGFSSARTSPFLRSQQPGLIHSLHQTIGNKAVQRMMTQGKTKGNQAPLAAEAAQGPVIQAVQRNVIQRAVIAHSEPSDRVGESDATWHLANIAATGERENFDGEVLNAIHDRQPNAEEQANGKKAAIRHIISYGNFQADVANLPATAAPTPTLANVAKYIGDHWPTKSIYDKPEIKGQDASSQQDQEECDNYYIQELADSWIKARHQDPSNLYIGDAKQNSGAGDRYDNPTRATIGGKSKPVFLKEDRIKLVKQQLDKLSIRDDTDITDIGLSIIEINMFEKDNLMMARLINAHKNKNASFNKVVETLSHQDYFKNLKLPDIFTTEDTPFGKA